jgi:translocation and assembly module TamB
VIRGGSVNPTARITLGKRITPDLSVQYSLDLRNSQERILSIEYTLSDRLSVLLTSSQTEGAGFDIAMRHSR